MKIQISVLLVVLTSLFSSNVFAATPYVQGNLFWQNVSGDSHEEGFGSSDIDYDNGYAGSLAGGVKFN